MASPVDESPNGDPTPLTTAIETYLSDKRVGDDDRPGKYYRHAQSVLTQWADWLDEEHAVATVEAIDTDHVRVWARSLREGSLAAASAHNYFAVVRAFLSWCQREGLLTRNPAEPERASEPLPDETGTEPDRQFWTAEARRDLVEWVQDRASSAYDRPMLPPGERRQRARDYAIVAMLAYSGARGAELFRSTDDARRNGITWADVDFDDEIAEVLGKSGEQEEVPLAGPASDALAMLHRELEAGVGSDLPESWPVFPTGHPPTLHRAVRDHLTDQDVDVDRLLDERDVETVAADFGVSVPALTVEGGRQVMQRICERAGVAVDGEYLKPHGGRRQLGDEVYREDAALAQQLLRHRNIETTKESYSYIETSEVGDVVDDVID